MNPVHEWYQEEVATEDMTKEAAAPTSKLFAEGELKGAAIRAAISGASLLGIMGAMEGYDAIKGSIQKARGFKRVMDANPDLKDIPADKARGMYSSIFTAAPTLAMDPNVAGSYMKSMHSYGGQNPKVLSDLASAESRYQKPMSPVRHALIGTTVGAFSDVGNPMAQARLAQMNWERENAPKKLKMEEERFALQQATGRLQKKRMLREQDPERLYREDLIQQGKAEKALKDMPSSPLPPLMPSPEDY